MNLSQFGRSAAVVAAVGILIGMAVSGAHGQDNRQRTQEQIHADLNTVSQELQQVMANPPEVLGDVQKREAAAPRAVPALRKMIGLFDEMHALDPQPELKQARMLFLALLDTFGEKAAAAELEAAVKSEDQPTRLQAQTSRLIVGWWTAGKDAEAQGKLLDEIEKLVEAHPAEPAVGNALMLMSQQGPANAEVRRRAEGIIVDKLQGPMAEQFRAHLESSRKLRSLEDKPLVLEGKLHDGSDFSSEQWKGKVILVDFWATWCGPCIAELPRVKKVYEQYHEQGLEVLGVSCDSRAADLERFLAQNPDMPWPQMFDAENPGWHALAEEYGVQGIPTMFLIDRKGVVRTVEARGNFEELIPKLLAESAE